MLDDDTFFGYDSGGDDEDGDEAFEVQVTAAVRDFLARSRRAPTEVPAAARRIRPGSAPERSRSRPPPGGQIGSAHVHSFRGLDSCPAQVTTLRDCLNGTRDCINDTASLHSSLHESTAVSRPVSARGSISAPCSCHETVTPTYYQLSQRTTRHAKPLGGFNDRALSSTRSFGRRPDSARTARPPQAVGQPVTQPHHWATSAPSAPSRPRPQSARQPSAPVRPRPPSARHPAPETRPELLRSISELMKVCKAPSTPSRSAAFRRKMARRPVPAAPKAPSPAVVTGPSCAICLESLHAESVNGCASLQCGHAFHAHCIQHWLAESRTCPLCKSLVPDFDGWQDRGFDRGFDRVSDRDIVADAGQEFLSSIAEAHLASAFEAVRSLPRGDWISVP